MTTRTITPAVYEVVCDNCFTVRSQVSPNLWMSVNVESFKPDALGSMRRYLDICEVCANLSKFSWVRSTNEPV